MLWRDLSACRNRMYLAEVLLHGEIEKMILFSMYLKRLQSASVFLTNREGVSLCHRLLLHDVVAKGGGKQIDSRDGCPRESVFRLSDELSGLRDPIKDNKLK